MFDATKVQTRDRATATDYLYDADNGDEGVEFNLYGEGTPMLEIDIGDMSIWLGRGLALELRAYIDYLEAQGVFEGVE